MDNKSDKREVYLIGISGGSASGKTSVSNIIFEKIGKKDCILFSMDSYYKMISDEERKNLSEYNFDHPNAFDFDLLYKHLCDLVNKKEIQMPIYNFTTSRREEHTQTIKSANVIIFEGILAFYDQRITKLMDLLIFVDTDDDVRLARRIYRDIRERGRNVSKVLERYMKFVKPAFDEYIKPTRKIADIIIPRGMDNVIAIDIIIQHIKIQLKDLFKHNGSITPSRHGSKKFANELLETKGFDFADKISILDINSNNYSIQIFEDIVDGNRVIYSELFKNTLLDCLVKLLVKKFNPLKYPFVLFSNDSMKINISDNCNNIIYFKSTIVNNEDIDKIKKQLISSNLLNDKLNIYLVTMIISPSCIEKILSDYGKLNIQFVSLFLTKMFTSFEEVFSSVLDIFSNQLLDKTFSEMINFIVTSNK